MLMERVSSREEVVEPKKVSSVRRVDVVEGVVEDLGPPSGAHEKAVVLRFDVRIGESVVPARRAASCLVAPAAGDRVTVALSDDDAFVTAILERGEGAIAAVELGGGVALEVDDERALRIRGARELHLAASEKTTLTSDDVRVVAGRARIVAKKVEAIGASLESSFHHVRQLGRIVEIVADEVSSRLKRSIRIVSDIDQTRAGVIDTRAEGIITIHGENTSVTARQIAKIDSNQVHIG
jgi:Protein of unknown function (DUF3540)